MENNNDNNSNGKHMPIITIDIARELYNRAPPRSKQAIFQ